MTKAKNTEEPADEVVAPAPVPDEATTDEATTDEATTDEATTDEATTDAAQAIEEHEGATADEFPELAQHPEDEGVEVAERGADIHEDSSEVYRKVIVIHAPKGEKDALKAYDYDSDKAAIVQELINNGLRVLEGDEVTFEGTEGADVHGIESLGLVYTVPVEPAGRVEVEPGETVSPRDVILDDEDHAKRDAAGEAEGEGK